MHGETRAVHSRLLQDALSDFAQDASQAFQQALADGEEIPFELESSNSGGRRRGTSLYTYRPLTGRFVREHHSLLMRLHSHDAAVRALEGFEGLERYLAAHGAPPPRRSVGLRARAAEALRAFVEEVFEDQSDFRLQEARLDGALSRLVGAANAEGSNVTLVATLHGVAIVSPEIALSEGLAIARPETLTGVPEEALWGDPWAAQSDSDADRSGRSASGGGHEDSSGAGRLIVALQVEQSERGLEEPIARGRQTLRLLLRALRLFGDGRIALGPLAWACSGDGPFRPLALGLGGHPHGMLVVRPEQEDELRAFCSLISRRTPSSDPLAWALGRFEMGCERRSDYEAISDHLLGLQALLEPQRTSDGLLSSRVAALCAPAQQRRATAQRMLEAIELERSIVEGDAVEHAAGIELCREVSSHLSALLRDMLCGHLKGDLCSLADELLLSGERSAPEVPSSATPPDRGPPRPAGVSHGQAGGSAQQVRGDLRERVDVLDVLVEVGDQDRRIVAEGP